MTRFAFIADDFTGALDALWQYRRFGLHAELVVDIDHLDLASPGLDVIGVATVLRSLPAEEIEKQVSPILDALIAKGVQVVQYKVCSTFDSSPDTGSIGRVIDVARTKPAFRGLIPVMPAQPDLGRYTVFSHHFARFADGEVHRIDRHPVMSTHPVTPAVESDLRVELNRQSSAPVSGLHTANLSDAELAHIVRTADVDGHALVIDTVTAEDAARVGRALDALSSNDDQRSPMFAVGSGGLSWALASAATAATPAGLSPALAPDGAVLALSGSRSSITATQIDVAERHGWLVIDLLADPVDAEAQARHALAEGRNVVLHTSRGARHDEQVSDRAGELLAHAALSCLDEEFLARIVVMGGDTSGAVLTALGVQAIQLKAMIPPMVPLCTVTSSDPRVARLDIALKGGQLGGPDYLLTLS